MSHAPSTALERRHQALRDRLRADQLDAMVVTSLPNLLYLTNFTGSSAVAVMTLNRLLFITDSRYVTAVGTMQKQSCACPNLELVVVDTSYDAALVEVLTRVEGRIGFEAAHLTVARHQWLVSTLGAVKAAALQSTEGVIERLRVVKDEFEIATFREAARRLASVAEGAFTEIRQGRTEREVAQAIDWRIGQAGFSRPAFDTIVAAGPNGALPHAHPGERKLAEGDLVVLDFGGVYDSYCVDLTRTVSVGHASARSREVYGAVLQAHDRAITAVRPGVSRFEIDAAARTTLHSRGLGDAFGHGTGHGLGIEVHEEPRISRRRPGIDHDGDARDAVQPGMVFTIEPGAYLPDWGGVRIEDDVLVTPEGVELLTHVTTELLEL